MKPDSEPPILCTTCDRYRLEVIRIGKRWTEARRCVEGFTRAGERVECVRYQREVGSDG